MTDTLHHRGPEDSGYQFLEAKKCQVGFGHRRLSIIDLSETGHQPMCDVTNQYWITFNGEIYNYLELKEELKNIGHVFVTQTDTEVVLEAYKEWGVECLQKFNGMFAFALFDKKNK